MESLFPKEKMNRCRKKVIPWHVQHRYMESMSQFSLNQTISAALYKKKINSLQRNNKHLAFALQQSRCLATEKENLLIDNGKILDIINFSRVKLMDMAVNMKQATECLDETLLLLNSSLNDSLSKHFPKNQNYRNDFKNKLQEISRNSPIKEESENSDGPNVNVQSCVRKGKISRVDGCISSPNKKCKLAKKGRTNRKSRKDVLTSAGESSSVTLITSKNAKVRITKKCGSSLNMKSQKRKNSLPKNSALESSSKLSKSTNSKRFLQAKTQQESLDKKPKAVKVILTDFTEAFLTQETENYHSPVKNGPTSSPKPNSKCFTSNSPEDDILIRNYFSSEFACKQKDLTSNSFSSKFATVNDEGMPDSSLSTSNSSSCDLVIDKKSPCQSPNLLPCIKEENFVCDQNNVAKIEQVENNDSITKQSCENCMIKTDSEKDKRSSTKSHNFKVINRVPFYYDEDAIEKMEGNVTASKDKIRKTINKCKARKTVSHKKKNTPAEGTSLKSNLILPENISKLGKNSFLVTAEVHSPPNGMYAQEIKRKMPASETMEPCVILTDIFKSNRELLSEMVGRNGLRENGCLKKTVTKPAVAPLVEMNTTFSGSNNSYNVNDVYTGYENTENRCLPEDRENIEKGKQRRRSKIVSYKEPSLNVKMRRLF